MIPNIFDCKWVDQIDDHEYQYVECTLVGDIGPYKADTEVKMIEVNYADGVIRIYETDDDEEPNWSGRVEYIFVGIKE